MLSHVFSKPISAPESLIAEVAGNDDPLEMVRLNVVFYCVAHPFLSTNFANMGFLISVW